MLLSPLMKIFLNIFILSRDFKKSLDNSNLQTMNKVEEENARLKGHQNPAQKLQHLLAIKKENHSLKEVSFSE